MEREKALNMALGQIEKQFGKGAIMRMGDDTQVAVASIPTGALSLDIALGVGGLPRGRVVEIYGPESSGKCLTADTSVWTDRGLETIAEVFERCGLPASCASRMTDVSDLGVRVVNEHGELEPVAALTHNDRHAVLRIRLRSGRTVSVTENHPLRVINERGFIVWRTAGALAVGDHIVSAAFGAVEAAEGDGLSEDEALLLGYLVAEGGLASVSATRFTSTDLEVGAELTSLVRRLFDRETRCDDREQGAVDDTALLAEAAERYGVGHVTAAGGTVPLCVRTGGHKAQRAFLSALFEGGGWIEEGSTIGLGTASEALARQVQLLLYGFGIPSTVSSSCNTTDERDDWTVTVDPSLAHRFLDEIGFRSARLAANVRRSPRDAQSEDLLTAAPQAPLRSQRPGEPDGAENIPGISGLIRDLRDDLGGDRAFDRCAGDLFRAGMDPACSRQRLVRIVGWADERSDSWTPTSRAIVEYLRHLLSHRYTFERIDSVEDGGVQPTFDIVLPRTHSFIANGMLSHNTTVALHAIAEAQKAGGIAAFIDAEHALDPKYAAALGVDIESLLVSQPDTGEQALEITDMLVRSGAVDIVVIDSVAALTPRAEIEGEMGDSHVGLQARLMSQALRKLAGTLSKSRTCAVFINQIREKIGVMFGCFDWSTQVTLADGSTEFIGKIVDQRMPVDVLSYDDRSGRMVARRVTDWFDNGVTDRFLSIAVQRPGGNGRASFAATPNHLINTPSGWREAGDLQPGDLVVQATSFHLSDFQWEVVLGGLLGNSALSSNQHRYSARLRWGHGSKQADYADWKASLFANIGTSRSTNDRGAIFHDMRPLRELADLRGAVHIGGKKVVSYDYLKRLTPLALAIWYMDAGTFALRSEGRQEGTRGGAGRSEICVEALDPTSRVRLQEFLRDEFGVTAELVTTAGNAILRFSTPGTVKLHRLIAPHVHPSMDHKLLPSERGKFNVAPVFDDVRYEPIAMPVTSIDERGPLPGRRHRYDIEVDGTHNYFVDGVMVHNSPETQPGGRALKFYSSVRLDVRRIESLKDGTDFVGNRVRVKVVKNKVAPPFRQAEFDILFGEGISKEGSILDVGVDAGFIRKAGAWYTYDGEQLGQGRENARTFLREHDDVAAEIYKKVTEHLGLTPSEGAGGDSDDGDPDGIL